MIRIAITGGGSGGHAYPLLAVVDALVQDTSNAYRITYLGPRSNYDVEFEKRGVRMRYIAGAKLRRYFSLQNILDIPKAFIAFIQSLVRLCIEMPDVLFSKGGTGALPVVCAAWFYRIPIVIHESDAIPGLTNRVSARFARRIAIAFDGVRAFFPESKTVFTGNPVRRDLTENIPQQAEAKRLLGVPDNTPLLLVLGGSQGAERINIFVVEHIAKLIERFSVLHQTGAQHLSNTTAETRKNIAPLGESGQGRYQSVAFFDVEHMKNALAAADVVLSRAGASAMYEIAAFGKPAVLIPIEQSANGHQKANAYEYAKTGAAVVVEEPNLTEHIVLQELQRMVQKKFTGIPQFYKPDAAEQIAKLIVEAAR
jgi:UDP-N-acetylglucosamine--N-acetylmuramyl-(pentapeptide) pyrophosphoryl-undecaprenol N-acetylglucosamine transferase